jgi:hypothetical protein
MGHERHARRCESPPWKEKGRPQETHNDFRHHAQDCLYLEESNPPAKLAAKTASERSGPSALPSYYGYAFEAYCTTSSCPPSNGNAPEEKEDFSIPNTNVQWCSVVKTSLGSFRTLVGGEVDCVRPGADPRHLVATRDFVELKTNLIIQSQRDEVNFERCAPRALSLPRSRRGLLSSLQRAGKESALPENPARTVLTRAAPWVANKPSQTQTPEALRPIL